MIGRLSLSKNVTLFWDYDSKDQIPRTVRVQNTLTKRSVNLLPSDLVQVVAALAEEKYAEYYGTQSGKNQTEEVKP